MNYYLVATSGVHSTAAKLQWISYKELEEVSKLFNVYKVVTDRCIGDIEKIEGVLEVREESECILN